MFTAKQSWYIGLLATLVVGLWEFLLHYTPRVLEINEAFAFFEFVPLQNLILGHFIVLFWIPLYFIWYYHLYLMLKWGWEKIAKLFFMISIVAFLAWGIWISTRWFIGHIVHMQNVFDPVVYNQIQSLYLFFFDSLLQALRYLILVISAFWVYLVMTGKTLYPKKMILCSPIVLLMLVFTTLWVPTIWKYLVPIALNIAHFILFSLSLYYLSQNTKLWNS